MDVKSIVTIREELSKDFLSLTGEQFMVVRQLVQQLDDDQLGTQLQLERYERERRQQIASQMSAAINISDGEQSPEQPPNVAGTGGGQRNEARVEQPEEVRPEEPDKAPVQQEEEPRTQEPEPEASRPVGPDTDRSGEEE